MDNANIVDIRSRKILFVSHCVLNQNAKVRGIAKYQATVKPVVELLLKSNVGIFQMPCPEMSYYGAMRWGQVKSQYDSPMFRKHCKFLVDMVLDQAEDYHRSGYELLGFVMVDGSPVCGLNRTPAPVNEDQIWGGMVWYTPEQKFVADQGVYCEKLQATAEERGLGALPFVAIPEVEEAGSFDQALKQIKKML